MEYITLSAVKTFNEGDGPDFIYSNKSSLVKQ